MFILKVDKDQKEVNILAYLLQEVNFKHLVFDDIPVTIQSAGFQWELKRL